jgi:hypothetical protein
MLKFFNLSTVDIIVLRRLQICNSIFASISCISGKSLSRCYASCVEGLFSPVLLGLLASNLHPSLKLSGFTALWLERKSRQEEYFDHLRTLVVLV